MRPIERVLLSGVGVLLVIFIGVAGYQLWFGDSSVQALSLFTSRVECGDQAVSAYLDELDQSLDIWDDNIKLADSTARMSLSAVINNLLDQKHRVAALEAPACATYITELATIMMDLSIDPYLAFMQEASDIELSSQFETAAIARIIFDDELRAFRGDALTAYRASNPVLLNTSTSGREASWQKSVSTWFDFYMPSDWSSRPSPDMYSAKFDNGKVFGSITFDRESQISTGQSPRANLTYIQIQSKNTFPLPQDKMEFRKLGENQAYVWHMSHKDGLGTQRIIGAIVSPSGNVLSVRFYRTGANLTEQDQQIVMSILASIEMP